MLQSFRAHPAQLARIREHIRALAGGSGVPPRRLEDLILAVSEAAANAIVHSGSDRIDVGWEAKPEVIVVEVRDRGVFRKHVAMPEVEGVGGHGIPLMMALLDEVSVREGTTRSPGTVVRMVLRLGSQAATG